MGWNVRRSKQLFPGVRLNLSNHGLGISVGPKHSKISLSSRGRLTSNLGIPGTGVRYTKRVELNPSTNVTKSKAVNHEKDCEVKKLSYPAVTPLGSPLEGLGEPLESEETGLSHQHIHDLIASPSQSVNQINNIPSPEPMIHLDIDAEYNASTPSEDVRKYIIITPENQGNPIWHPELFDINTLKIKAHLKQLTPETIIIDSYTGQHHTAGELLGIYLF